MSGRSEGDADDEVRSPRRIRPRWWVLLGTVGVVVLAWLVASSGLLEVREIAVTGALAGRESEVRAASGVARGDALVTVWPGRVAGRVEALPWVARAKVRRSFPHTVEIAVVARTPVGWVRLAPKAVAGRPAGPERYLLVDGSGQVLWRAREVPTALPELLGAADVARPGGSVKPVALARVAAALDPELRNRASSVTLEDGSVVVAITGGPKVRFGRPERIRVKSRVAAAVLGSLPPGPVGYLDVSVPSAPVSGP